MAVELDMGQLPSDQARSGRTFGTDEMRLLEEVLESGVLTATKGTKVPLLAASFAGLLGARFAFACSSGTAAIHAAVAAVDPEPGEEIITTPITDMGALTPILYQGAIPVFADVDPRTGNLTAETIAQRVSERTRAIVVTHLFGNPCEMGDIMALASSLGVPVIEDCAQAYLATSAGRTVGTIGAIGCFSLQQGKHITCGEGGLVVTDDEALARRVRLFIDKGWGYGESNHDHEFLAPNHRMSELQGAVALAQLARLEDSVRQRVAMASRLSTALTGLPGVETPWVHPDNHHVYWRYVLRADPGVVPDGPAGVARELAAFDVASIPRYIQKPAFRCAVFAEQRTFGRSRYPFTLARPDAVDYSDERFPGTDTALAWMLVLPWNERYQAHHVDYLATAIARAVFQLTGGAP
ncbi:MAG: DegT/DnrJ/EryC1/StrS family aminotransferase [Acidimicrobiales bacterium]